MIDREKVIKPIRGYEGLYAVDKFEIAINVIAEQDGM